MTFPNPANYYLPTPAQFEAEIVELDLQESTLTIYEVVQLLNDVNDDGGDQGINSSCLSTDADAWIGGLKTDELINLIRWIAERLAYLHHKESIGKP
jgi:hypothetical protein